MAEFNGNWFAYEGDRMLESMEEGFKEIEKEIDIVYGLSCNANVVADARCIPIHDKDGYDEEIDDSDVDYRQCFEDQHLTPIQLINYLKELMFEKINENPNDSQSRYVVDECMMWSQDFEEVN